MTGEAWDHIIIGAGSAGCTAAARFARAGRRVLLLEAGGADDGRNVKVPLFVARLINDPERAWQFRTEPEPATGNRSLLWPRGKMIGGSSSINGMIWMRGEPTRYDEWAASGCAGWDWRSVEPFFREIEDFPAGDPAVRGRGGPVSICEVARGDRATQAFIEACASIGIPETQDYNGTQQEGAGRFQLSTRRGRRYSAADAFLRPALRTGNVDVRTKARVHRILFDGRRAVGVEFRDDSGMQRARSHGDIILAAGTVQSPHILELSGVGDPQRLTALGIPVTASLLGVGENLSDHYHLRVTYRAAGMVTVNDLVRRPWLHGPPAWLRYHLFGTGMFSTVAPTVHVLARSKPGLNYPDLKLNLHKMSSGDRTKGQSLDPYSGASIGMFQTYPDSRGSVHADSPDPEAAPRIRPNYLGEESDQQAAVEALRLARKLGAAAPLKPFIKDEMRPGPNVRSYGELLDFARATGQTSYHPVGTCRMGTDRLAVVDPQGRVHGVDGLRVADASIMPFLTTGHTNAPSMVIGARIAQFVLAQANR